MHLVNMWRGACNSARFNKIIHSRPELININDKSTRRAQTSAKTADLAKVLLLSLLYAEMAKIPLKFLDEDCDPDQHQNRMV